jgi:uncharacterized damage-inducible protein DinB
MSDERAIRELLGRMLAWEDAHVGFEAAVAKIPAELRGKQPNGVPHSAWQLLDHLRRTQYDILDFCRNPNYQELEWPEDYWPPTPAPPEPAAWDEAIAQFKDDRKALQDLALDPNTPLTAKIPHGSGQTYAREFILAADHVAYHIGQLVLVRRLLGIWNDK